LIVSVWRRCALKPIDDLNTSETRSRPSPRRHSLRAQLAAPGDAQRGRS
jgi:hypothetical protein